MAQGLNRIIRRSLMNETRRQNERRIAARPPRAAVVSGSSTVNVAGQVFSASNIGAPAGTTLAVQNVGRPANALYVPARAAGVAFTVGGAGGGGGGGGGGGAVHLDDLTDVTLTAPASGNTLQYNSATGQWINVVPLGGAGGAPSPHPLAISGGHHTPGMLLPWTDLNKSGSSLDQIATRPHSMLTGISPNDHHYQQHLLATGTALGDDHTISGGAAGAVLRASDATHANFQALHHTDLDTIGPDQHHRRDHNIITGDIDGNPVHSITGNALDLVGATALNTLGLVVPSSNPGATQRILKTAADGSLQLDTSLFYVDAPFNRIGINVVPGAGPLGGAAALDIRAAQTGDITQRIRQIAGQTQRLWRVEDTSGNELIVMDSVGNLQSGSPGFVSGLLGWQITPQGNAEFNNIWARGELHATVFVKDEVHATGGTFFVATAGVLHDDADINSTLVDDEVLVIYSTPAGMGVPLEVVTTSPTFTGNQLHVAWVGNFLNINDPPSGPAFYFQPGDVVRSKTEVPTGVTDFWFEIINGVQYSGYSSYSVIKRSGTDGKLPKGSAVVSYGKQGDGRIMMTSDLNYAPYIDVFTTGTNVWLSTVGSVIPRMRMGRLDGIGLPGVSGVEQYGMIAGKDLSNANEGYFIASNLQFSLYKINLRLNDGSNDTGLWSADGNLKIGKNVGAAATTGFSFDPASGDVIIGNPALTPPNYLRWNQASGTLIVQGTLLVTDPGGTVTLADVNALDNIVRTDAGLSSTGYAGQARDIAIGYSDARRIIGVGGSWYSPGTNQVSWGTKGTATGAGGTALSVVFANPTTTRAIADPTGASITIAARTYLYVNMAGATPMPMLTTTSIATVSGPNNVLIAVCDPGDPTAPAAARLASITVVAGSTYVSGGNIFTGSITAQNIAANTITANKLDASTLTVTYLDPIADAAAIDATNKATTAQTNAATDATTKDNAVKVVAAADATSKANTAQQNAINAAALDATQKAADAAAAAQSYGDKYKLTAMRGSMVVTGRNSIQWGTIVAGGGVAITLFYADGFTKAIPDGSFTALSTTARSYIFYNYGAATFVQNTTLAALSNLSTLIAVFDPGILSPAPGGGTSADFGSLSIVAGATYISGNNIVTGGIVAANIKAGAITVDKLQAQSITVGYLDPNYVNTINNGITSADNKAQQGVDDAAAAATAAANAQTAAQTYGNNRRVVGVTGTWFHIDGITIGWTALRVKFANGSDRGITFQNTHGLAPAGRHYLYVNVAGTGNMAMVDTTDIGVIGIDHALIAVVDTGAVQASISVVAGSTYISGDNIMTGSIVASNIAATAITADKMSVTDLNAITGGVGTLTVTDELIIGNAVGKIGSIHSVGKDTYSDATAGFFVGYDTGFPLAAYKFKVGDLTKAEFSWDGSSMAIAGTQSLQIRNTATGQIFSLSGPSSAVGLLTLNASGVLVFSGSAGTLAALSAPQMTANKFIQTGDTLYLTTPRVVASAQTMPGSLGFKGEMCWGIDALGVVYLYLCYSDNNWRRIPFPTTTW